MQTIEIIAIGCLLIAVMVFIRVVGRLMDRLDSLTTALRSIMVTGDNDKPDHGLDLYLAEIIRSLDTVNRSLGLAWPVGAQGFQGYQGIGFQGPYVPPKSALHRLVELAEDEAKLHQSIVDARKKKEEETP